MDRTRWGNLPLRHLAHRFLWLVVVPTASCFAVWGMLTLSPDDEQVAAHLMASVLPLVGVASILGYRWVSRDQVLLLPYAPFGIGAAVFTISMVDLARAIAREPGGAFIPILQYGLGFLLPFVAFGCGIFGFTLVGRRTEP